MKLAIIGMGVVGQAQQRWLKDHVHITYDPKTDDTYPREEIAQCDFAVVCVPTPMREDGSCNTDYVEAALQALPNGVPVLLRSTVTPGTTEELGPHVVFCPEFIQEDAIRSVWKDPNEVPFLILGGLPDITTMIASNLSQIYQGKIHSTSSRAAELTKYVVNLFLATKVTFANEMSRVCSTFGVGWEEVERLWRADPRTGFTHTSVLGKGGFGGACFPKDLSAIIAAAELGEYDASFLKAVRTENRRFRGED